VITATGQLFFYIVDMDPSGSSPENRPKSPNSDSEKRMLQDISDMLAAESGETWPLSPNDHLRNEATEATMRAFRKGVLEASGIGRLMEEKNAQEVATRAFQDAMEFRDLRDSDISVSQASRSDTPSDESAGLGGRGQYGDGLQGAIARKATFAAVKAVLDVAHAASG
jgi:hypothetical protein